MRMPQISCLFASALLPLGAARAPEEEEHLSFCACTVRWEPPLATPLCASDNVQRVFRAIDDDADARASRCV